VKKIILIILAVVAVIRVQAFAQEALDAKVIAYYFHISGINSKYDCFFDAKVIN